MSPQGPLFYFRRLNVASLFHVAIDHDLNLVGRNAHTAKGPDKSLGIIGTGDIELCITRRLISAADSAVVYIGSMLISESITT